MTAEEEGADPAVRWQRLQRWSRRLGRALGSVPPSPPFPLQGITEASLRRQEQVHPHALAPAPRDCAGRVADRVGLVFYPCAPGRVVEAFPCGPRGAPRP